MIPLSCARRRSLTMRKSSTSNGKAKGSVEGLFDASGARTPVTKDKSLESWIWDAACSIRGAQEAPKFKDFILPLIFTKRLCDVFDDELNRIVEQVGSRAKAFTLV